MPLKTNVVQLEHHNFPFTNKKFPVILVCDGVSGPANIGSLFRLSEAMGVDKLIFGNTEIDLNSTRLKRTARGTEKFMESEISEDLEKIIDDYIKLNYRVFALEITKTSEPLENLTIAANNSVVWIIGSEQRGISEELLSLAHKHYHINMFGNNSSMNAVNATSMALFQTIKIYNSH